MLCGKVVGSERVDVTGLLTTVTGLLSILSDSLAFGLGRITPGLGGGLPSAWYVA
jgi:hypothetical protein